MLSFLRNSSGSGSSRTTSASCSSRETEPVLVRSSICHIECRAYLALQRLSIDSFRDTIPHFQWSKVAHKCVDTVAPWYSVLRDTLHNDVENLAQLFIELEASYDNNSLTSDEVCMPVSRISCVTDE